jgi:pimeloyl-ACP methyl ester carboxylesterase
MQGYNEALGKEEHILHLPNGRQLAYARNGPPTSRTLVLFFSGIMSVGIASDVPKSCREIEAHWIAPTLPGMGNTSTRDETVPYHVGLATDMNALLSHLYPTGAFDTLYIAGGSYGTAPAQMLYGASYELFPAGRKIVAGLLIAGVSPFKYNRNYAKSLSWQNWFSLGPPAHNLPFRPLQRLFRATIGSKLKTIDGAKDFLHQTLFKMMDQDEKQVFARWLESKNKTEAEFIDDGAQMAVRSCQNWQGFMEVADVVHSDWGFNPAALDDEHASKPVLVVSSKSDHLGGSTNAWLVENYKNASLKEVPGGHISSMFYMDEIFQELIRCKCPDLHHL